MWEGKEEVLKVFLEASWYGNLLLGPIVFNV